MLVQLRAREQFWFCPELIKVAVTATCGTPRELMNLGDRLQLKFLIWVEWIIHYGYRIGPFWIPEEWLKSVFWGQKVTFGVTSLAIVGEGGRPRKSLFSLKFSGVSGVLGGQQLHKSMGHLGYLHGISFGQLGNEVLLRLLGPLGTPVHSSACCNASTQPAIAPCLAPLSEDQHHHSTALVVSGLSSKSAKCSKGVFANSTHWTCWITVVGRLLTIVAFSTAWCS